MKAALSFIELSVRDWDAALAWYQRVLRLEVALRDEKRHFALLRAGTSGVALKQSNPAPGGTRLVFEVDDLDEWREHLLAQGVTPEGGEKISDEGYRRLRLVDLDGYEVTLFQWLN